MRVKFRSFVMFPFILTIATLFIVASHASAQTGETVRVISLSKSGYEQAFALTFSPDGKYFAVGGSSGIYLFDAQKLSEIDLIQTNARARSVVFLPGSNTLAAGLFDNTIKLWHIPEDRLMTNLQGHQGWVRSVSVSGDGSLLASASDDNTVRVWKVSNGNLLLTLDKNTEGVRAVALSPDGKLVAAALRDKTVRVWRVPDGELLYTLSGHTDWVRCLAFSPDGNLLASGSFDMTVRLWSISNGQLLQTLRGHTSSILKVTFSPDGKILASSSVDETVRLWQVSDGNLIRVLQGYTDFIYALGFSPDGKTLASGGGDNALRLWNLDALGITSGAITGHAENPAGVVQSTTPDCRQCHHRQGQIRPARVIDLSCEGCHAGGIGQSFCIAFPRSSSVGSLPIAYRAVNELSGLPIDSDEIAVVIAAPGNGETLYVRDKIMAPEVITGKVFYADQGSITKVDIRLDILSGGQKTSSLNTHPSRDGTFTFNVAINPKSPPPILPKPGIKICLACHGDFIPEAGLPKGEIRIVVTAMAPDGQHASDERWVRVDPSKEAMVPVQIIDDITRKPLSGLSIDALTILYQWRNRFGSATSDMGGIAQLKLDALSQVPTVYNVSIAPQVLNGILYSSLKPVQVELQPDTISHPIVMLAAHAQSGQITGNFEDGNLPASLQGIKVWAIQLPAGPAYQTSLTSKNAFVFDKVPVSQYLVVPDLPALAKKGLFAHAQNVNLLDAPQTAISFSLAKGRPLSGNVVAKDGSFLPFAWVNIGDRGNVQTVHPTSGGFLIPDLPSDNSFITVSAPGYYTQSRHIASLQDGFDFQLVPKPETLRVAWGNGQVIIPSETNAAVNGLDISFDNGWLWGKDGSQPLTIHLSGLDVSILGGEFALENPVGKTGWLYLYQGNAQLKLNGGQAPVEVGSGQMVALTSGAKPFQMNETVTSALHPSLDEVPINETVEPSLGARLENWLERAGIGVAQIITFITYILSLVALFTIPTIVLYLRRRKRLNGSHLKENH